MGALQERIATMRGISKAVQDSKLSPKDELVDFYVCIP
jgi:hypothetical protein